MFTNMMDVGPSWQSKNMPKDLAEVKQTQCSFAFFGDPVPCVLLVHNHPHLTLLVFQYATPPYALALEVSFHPSQLQGSSDWHNSQAWSLHNYRKTSQVDKQQNKAFQPAMFVSIRKIICCASCYASLLPVSNGASENPRKLQPDDLFPYCKVHVHLICSKHLTNPVHVDSVTNGYTWIYDVFWHLFDYLNMNFKQMGSI